LAARKNPQLTHAAKPATFEVEAYNERGEMVPTAVAGEHPLTLYLDKREIVTLMTLGHAPEALAIGYLRNQRLAESIDDIAAVQVDWETDSVAITTHSKKPLPALDKKTVTSGCGRTGRARERAAVHGARLLVDRLVLAHLFDQIEELRVA